MAKSNKNFFEINFDVPQEYHFARLLKEATSSLPDWIERSRKSKVFSFGWDNIISKIKKGEQLADKELTKAILFVDLIPRDLIVTLKNITIENKEGDLIKQVALKINKNFLSFSPVRFLFEIDEMEKFNKEFLLLGLNEFKSEIINEGKEGLLGGIIEKKLSLNEIENKFKVDDKYQNEELIMTLVNDLVDLDRKAGLFELNAVEFIKYLTKRDQQGHIAKKFDYYLGFFLNENESWEGKVLSDDYAPVKLMNFYLNKFNYDKDSLPLNIRRIYEQRENLENAIDLLNEQEPDRGNFWKKYMPESDRVIPKKSRGNRNEVAVAFFFGDIVIVEFAPKGNAAYIYKKSVFEEHLLDASEALDWKSKNHTYHMRNITQRNGRLFHHHRWQRKFSRIIRSLQEKKKNA